MFRHFNNLHINKRDNIDNSDNTKPIRQNLSNLTNPMRVQLVKTLGPEPRQFVILDVQAFHLFKSRQQRQES